MLNVEYSERFLKDLRKLKKTNVYKKIYDLYLSTINEDSDEFEKKINIEITN